MRRRRRFATILWMSATVSPGLCSTISARMPPWLAGQALAQPGLDDLEEGEIGLVAIHDAGAGIDVGLDRIGLDQALAEAVDGRAGDFVDRGARGGEIVALGFGQTIGQRDAQLGRDLAGREVGDELADARRAARSRRVR